MSGVTAATLKVQLALPSSFPAAGAAMTKVSPVLRCQRSACILLTSRPLRSSRIICHCGGVIGYSGLTLPTFSSIIWTKTRFLGSWI